MPAYIARRTLEGILSLWVILTLVFLLMRVVPGDPAEAVLAQSTASESVLERRRSDLGLDRPMMEQYFRSLFGVVSDESMVSWSTSESVRIAVTEQFDSTALLATASMGIAILAGLALGLTGALGIDPFADAGRSVAGLFVAVPIMLSGTLLIWFFSITLAWLPATGQIGFQSLILPALAVGLSTSGAIARAVDAAVSDVMDFPFILAARARGLPRNKIIWQHALPVALAPILDIVSVQFGYLLAGTIVAETVFARQGLGRLLLVAVLNKDLPLVQGVVAVNAFFYIVFSIIADVLRGSVDPRIRFE